MPGFSIFTQKFTVFNQRKKNSVGHFGKWLPLRSRGKSAMVLELKLLFRACCYYIPNLMLLSTNEQLIH